MQKEFKVGDRIKIKEGVSEGYYEAGAEGVVLEVCSEDILIKFDKGIYDTDCGGTWYVGFDEVNVIEEEEKHQYKEGDKVVFLYLEEGGNKEYDEERFTLGKIYVVYDDYGEKHIRVFDDNNCTAFAHKDQVKLVQEEEVQEVPQEVVNPFKVGDKVRLVHPELAEAVHADSETFPEVGVVYELTNNSTQSWVRVEGTPYFWPNSSIELVQQEAQLEKEDKYTVEEVLSAFGSLRDSDYSYMIEETEKRLLQERDPEWEDYQRLKIKFEG